MRLLFINGAYAPGMEASFRAGCKNADLQNAANAFQSTLIQGFVDNSIDIDILCAPFLPAFPFHYNTCRIPKSLFVVDDVYKLGESVGYCNFAGIKEFSIRYVLRSKVKEWLEKHKDEDRLIILFYSLYSPFIQSTTIFKKDYPNLRICPIVTDLVGCIPEIIKWSLPKMIQQKREERIVRESYTNYDYYVLLTEQMEEMMPHAKGKNIVIEGIYAGEYYQEKKEGRFKKTLLYTGALSEWTNIVDLVNAFHKIMDNSIRLMICGSGPFEQYIKDSALNDERIEFLGALPRERVLELQRKATCLINPRKPNIELTKYSFPSKTMEYLASGTPMIGYKLEGIPVEYYNYMYTIDDLTEETLISTVYKVLLKDQDELDLKGQQAMMFIRDNKSARNQVKKLWEFLLDS